MRYPPNAYRKYLETAEVMLACVHAWFDQVVTVLMVDCGAQQRREREKNEEAELEEELEGDDL